MFLSIMRSGFTQHFSQAALATLVELLFEPKLKIASLVKQPPKYK
jgi:hypothetical protein